MKYFLDTEYIEGTQKKRFLGIPYKKTKPTIDLISIGITSETYKSYFAISKEFNVEEAWYRAEVKNDYPDAPNAKEWEYKEYWTRENVLKPLFKQLWQMAQEDTSNSFLRDYFRNHSKAFGLRSLKVLLECYGLTNKEIADGVKDFVYSNSISLISNSPSMPIQFYTYHANFNWVVFCWLFGNRETMPKFFPLYSKDLKVMLVAQEEFMAEKFPHDSSIKLHPDYPKQKDKHHALQNAGWNLKLYNYLRKLKNKHGSI